jgi:uncharacterized protein
MLRAVTPPPPRSLIRQFLRLQVGLCVFAFALSLMLEAHVGLDPWSSFHDGVTGHTELSFGRTCQITGLGLILISALFLRTRPGIGTLFNMAVIGPWIDLFHVQAWFPVCDGGPAGFVQFIGGMLLLGFATGLYIGADLGAGPRDGFVLGLASRLAKSIRVTRIGIEVTILISAWVLGGELGWGTVIFAFGMGPIMQASLRWMGVGKPVRPEVESEPPV